MEDAIEAEVVLDAVAEDAPACKIPEKIEPFLKWAGGKRWFAERHLDLLPTSFKNYIEPFLGSGAVYFSLQPAKAILSDLNGSLIDCYQAIRDYPGAIAENLLKHHVRHGREYYYEVRSSIPTNPIERAGRFLYLNRTCWNGLYRVNQRNEFNVPIGTKQNVILPNDDFARSSSILKKATLKVCDFEETLDQAGLDDFAFVDPPYTVKHNQNGFLKYNDKIFSWSDQVRLRDAVLRAAGRGAKVLVTNANHESLRELYDGVGHLSVVDRASVLAARAKHRMPTQELIIRTWSCNLD